MVFSEPREVLLATDVAQVVAVVEEACRRVAEERVHVAGFLSYESAPAFDAAYMTRPPGVLPLACFGVFSEPELVSGLPPPAAGRRAAPSWHLDVDRECYRRHIAEIRGQIASGNTYQVNYTVRQRAAGTIDAWQLFLDIATDAPYAAFVEMQDQAIVSASPELFFELSGQQLICRPMKGTAARGMTTAEDDRIRAALVHSTKDRAENVMIADMVRNDLGRIALPGSVQARSLYDVEKYRTVWQMTSTITAATDAPLAAILRALFPSASITGAPKVASMRLIAGLEQDPRQVYTGCIGYLAPNRQARFNVAIRTAVVDHRRQTAVYGVGGGIVWDSDADSEYQECLNKAKVLSADGDARQFELLETLLWTPGGGCHLLEEHLQRLADSARYFDFCCDEACIAAELDAFTAGLPAAAQRIRLRLAVDGALQLEAADLALSGTDGVLRVRLAGDAVDPRNPWLYHKTTRRDVYERALASAGDCDDALLWNDRDELTESTVANIVVRLQGELYTPPVSCGLLAGTERRHLLERGEVSERIIRVEELSSIEALYLLNSLRGRRRAVIAEKSTATG